MVGFTFSELGRAIAIIRGGEHNGKIIYLNDSMDSDRSIPVDRKICVDQAVSDIKKTRDREIMFNKVHAALNHNIEPRDPVVKEYYDLCKEILDGRRTKEICIEDGIICPLPNSETRECSYVCGQSGSGKSYYVAGLVREYCKMFPDNRVVLFSKISDDKAFNDKSIVDKITRIELSELIEYPIVLEDLADSFVIFDDLSTTSDKVLLKVLMQLQQEILELGRHHRIYFAGTNHLITDFLKTKVLLAESHYYTIYPQSGNIKSINYLLETYVGLSKENIKKVMGMNSRWVTISKNFPTYIMSEHRVFLPN